MIMKRANYDEWLNRKYWTIRELVFLVKGWEPVDTFDTDDDFRDQFIAELSEWEKWSRGCSADRLEYANKNQFLKPQYECNQLFNWASKLIGVTIDEELRSRMIPTKTKQKGSDYKEIDPRERTTFLLIIGALAIKAGVSLENHHSGAKEIMKALEGLGIERSERTLAEKLQEAKDEMKENRSPD